MGYRAASIDSALKRLRAGGAVILPTDTVYGLGLAVKYAAGPGELFSLKRRPSGKPVAWLVDGIGALDRYCCDVPDYAYSLAADAWPGGLTLILRAADTVPPAFRGEDGSIGLRMPACAVALELIGRVGCPLATTSANLAGLPPARTFAELPSELLESVPALQALDPCSGIASTVVDCRGAAPAILRQGDVYIGPLQPQRTT